MWNSNNQPTFVTWHNDWIAFLLPRQGSSKPDLFRSCWFLSSNYQRLFDKGSTWTIVRCQGEPTPIGVQVSYCCTLDRTAKEHIRKTVEDKLFTIWIVNVMNKIKSVQFVLYFPATFELINIIKPLVRRTLKVKSRAFYRCHFEFSLPSTNSFPRFNKGSQWWDERFYFLLTYSPVFT